jgi:hypothetical protein
MVGTGADHHLIEHFGRYVRPQEGAGEAIFVAGAGEQDFLLETDIVFAYPKIPREQAVNVRHRFNINESDDGPFLCVIVDKHRDVPIDNCVITTRGMYWWDAERKESCRLSWLNLDMAYPQLDFPRRGLKLTRKKTENAAFIRLYVHEALLEALASFICSASHLASSLLVDINSATTEELLVLPLMTTERAHLLIQRRKELHGFRNLEHVRTELRLHPQEIGLWQDKAIVLPYKRERSKARRVDY